MSEHGAFILLLVYCWDQKGPAPLDERQLVGICNARSKDEIEAMGRILQEFFVKMGDGWYNRRMQQEIERSHAIGIARSIAGAKGYQARAKQLPSKSIASASKPPPPSYSPPSPKDSKPLRAATAAASAETWNAYSVSYLNRYQTEPARNAKVNRHLSDFVKRVGQTEAPMIAAFYVGHDNRRYIESLHDTAFLLRDAEALRTQWATGRKVTSTTANQTDRKAGQRQIFSDLNAEFETDENNGKK